MSAYEAYAAQSKEGFRNELKPILNRIKYEDIKGVGCSLEWIRQQTDLHFLNTKIALCVRMEQEDITSDEFVKNKKLELLVRSLNDAKQWRNHVLPIVSKEFDNVVAKKYTSLAYYIRSHEHTLISLLSSVLFRQASVSELGVYLPDTVDLLASYAIKLLQPNSQSDNNSKKDALGGDTMGEIDKKAAWAAASGLCQLAQNSTLDESTASRMINKHDVPCLLARLILAKNVHPKNEQKPAQMTFVTRTQGLLWMGLAGILQSPCRYKINSDTRRKKIFSLIPYLDENAKQLKEDLPFIEQLHRALLNAQIADAGAPLSLNAASSSSSTLKSPFAFVGNSERGDTGAQSQARCKVELVGALESDNKKYTQKFCEQVANQVRKIWMAPQAAEVDQFATVMLSVVLNLDDLECLIDEPPRCAVCGIQAEMRCSSCRNEYYCGRKCQVLAWPKHKGICSLHKQKSNLP